MEFLENKVFTFSNRFKYTTLVIIARYCKNCNTHGENMQETKSILILLKVGFSETTCEPPYKIK